MPRTVTTPGDAEVEFAVSWIVTTPDDAQVEFAVLNMVQEDHVYSWVNSVAPHEYTQKHIIPHTYISYV